MPALSSVVKYKNNISIPIPKMADVSISCKTCGKKVLMEQMKYDPDNRKLLVCPECYSNKVSKKNVTSRTRTILTGMQDRKGHTQDTGAAVEYKCSSCGFSFKRGLLSKLGSSCPNCNSGKTVKKISAHTDWVKGLQ